MSLPLDIFIIILALIIAGLTAFVFYWWVKKEKNVALGIFWGLILLASPLVCEKGIVKFNFTARPITSNRI